MTIKELSKIEHPYTCSTTNFLQTPRDEKDPFETWQDFIEEYSNKGEWEISYNLVFRWDIIQDEDDEGNDAESYLMNIFIIQQRKGHFVPITIQSVTDDDVESILEYLKPHYEELKNMWKPFVS